MQDSGMQDENIQPLGEEGLRAGGQPPMKLGYISKYILNTGICIDEKP
jgi:hypothetical protein